MFSNHIHLARWVLWQMDLLQLQAADWTLWFGHHGCGEFLVWVVSCQGSSCWPLQQQRHEVWTSPASSVLVSTSYFYYRTEQTFLYIILQDRTDISIHHITGQNRHLYTAYYMTKLTSLYIILQDRTNISIHHITGQNRHLYTSYYRTEQTSLYIILQDRTDISHKMCLWVWAK